MHTILLVEDNPTTRKLVRFALEKKGYCVLVAPDARSAIALMAQKPDLVLQDIILPDMDGFALVSALRALPGGAETPILAFSGYVSKLEEARISAVGFDDVITKPIEPTQLLAIIEARLPSPAPEEPQFGAGRRLLLADDEPIQLKLSRFRLARLGFTIETAASGDEALALACSTKPDVIVSDVTMPGLDGFGLCAALRQEPSLERIPLFLITSSYVEPMDRDLARRSGATDLLQRTPDLRDLVHALRGALLEPPRPPHFVPESLPELERERARRALRQLERQVQLNTGLARRCSALAAELTVLAGISETVVNHRDLNKTLDEALAACFDAGGISVGALYLLDAEGSLSARTLGGNSDWRRDDLGSFFGHEALLRRVIEEATAARIPSSSVPQRIADDLLGRCAAKSALIMPLVYGSKALGALVMISKGNEFDQEDWQAFAQGVCNQISQVLTLAAAFAAKEEAERKAGEQAALLSALIENAPDFVAHIDADGSIRFINRAFPGVPMSSIVGSSWLNYQQPEHATKLAKTLAAVIHSGEPASYETVGLGADGTTTWYSARLGPIRRDGVIVGAVLMLRDISDRKQAEAQLMLSDRMASVGTLAAGVAHEINNPLASVLANLELALRSLDENAGTVTVNAALVRDAFAGAERVQHIVRDLKVFSRSEEDSRGPVNLERVVESALRLADNEIRHRARVCKRYSSVPNVEANESRLGQVFLNLIVNAAQAIPEGHFEENELRIEIDTDSAGRVVVAVTDTGEGIPAEARQRIFTPFFTTKPIGVGTGLGLSICHRIVTSFGGTISFETETGKGTTFQVVLPPSSQQLPTVCRESSDRSPATRRGRILVIDDDERIGRVVVRIFETEHDVTWAHSGRHALELIDDSRLFDVILCDLMMPQMTGMDVYEQLRLTHPHQVELMVFLTGGAFTPRAREFLDRAPNQRLEKPFNVEKLRTLVNQLVR